MANKPTLIIVSSSVLILILGIIIFLPSPNRALVDLPIGSTYAKLLSVAGKPSYVTDGTLWVEPEYKKEDNQIIKGCVKEAWYESFVKIIPSKYSFCFDANDIMLNKYHWVSW